jgi:hypothetical protein
MLGAAGATGAAGAAKAAGMTGAADAAGMMGASRGRHEKHEMALRQHGRRRPTANGLEYFRGIIHDLFTISCCFVISLLVGSVAGTGDASPAFAKRVTHSDG